MLDSAVITSMAHTLVGLLEKKAVSLLGLMRAVRPEMDPRFIEGVPALRRMLPKMSPELSAGLDMIPGSFSVGYAPQRVLKAKAMLHTSPEDKARMLSELEAANTPFKAIGSRVVRQPFPYEFLERTFGVRPPKTVAGKTAWERTIDLHELRELREARRPQLGFSGHHGLAPMLQDLNIAATLKGPGEEAAQYIRGVRRSELAALSATVPGSERFPFGRQRISRHMIRGLQRRYEHGAKKATEDIPAYVQRVLDAIKRMESSHVWGG